MKSSSARHDDAVKFRRYGYGSIDKAGDAHRLEEASEARMILKFDLCAHLIGRGASVGYMQH